MPTNKKVSVGWQMIALMFWPTGLWAYNRIGKLMYGIFLYLGMAGLITGVGIGLTEMFSASIRDDVSPILVIIYYLIPMLYIRKWSKEWNEKIDRQNTQPSS
jgi:hypothetical protein